MMDNLRYKLTKFMQGRYGVDNLSRFLLWILIALIIFTTFVRFPLGRILEVVLLIVLYYRIFSKNISKRYRENEQFLRLQSRFLSFFKNFRSNMSQLRDYHIYKCPHCNQRIRIPRGKGHIMVRCPSCGYEFHKKS